MDVIIITGGSKGIGKAIAKKYVNKNYKVYSLARSTSDLKNVTQITVDLSNLKDTEACFKNLLEKIKKQIITSITLINNAGRLGKISTIENLTSNDITNTIQLNIATPIVLTSLFIKSTQSITCKKQVINISSGAATKPYEGWSVYCTSKAAIDMLTKTVASEQKLIKNGVKCIALYPGVVDTNMQSQIRETSESDFKNLQRFINLKENKELYTTEFVADTIYKIDTENRLENGAIFDIRNV